MASKTAQFSLKIVTIILFLAALGDLLVSGCLITNCPRGGKRSGKFGFAEPGNIKQCIACGPGGSGQCFGPSICCGPFGCLIGTPETLRCQRDGMFHEMEPCVAGSGNCRKNSGRCATEGICCSQDSCYTDKHCSSEDKKLIRDNFSTMELYNLLGYQASDIANE